MSNNTKVAWIGFAGVVVAAVIGAVVVMSTNTTKQEKTQFKTSTVIQTTSGNNSPAISGVMGNVTVTDKNNP